MRRLSESYKYHGIEGRKCYHVLCLPVALFCFFVFCFISMKEKLYLLILGVALAVDVDVALVVHGSHNDMLMFC